MFGVYCSAVRADNIHGTDHRAIQQCMLHMSPFCLAALFPFPSFPFPAHFPYPQEDRDLPLPVKVPFSPLIQISEAVGEMQGVINQKLVERALSVSAFNELLQNITELFSF